MYTQRLENPHNALWESARIINSRVSPEDDAVTYIGRNSTGSTSHQKGGS